MAEPPRRFPPPWRADRIPGGYVVRDDNGQAIAYIYSRANEAEARQAKVLTADEARRIAANIARLPELLGIPCPRSFRNRRAQIFLAQFDRVNVGLGRSGSLPCACQLFRFC
jgi:hypothetical protein